MKPKEYGPDPGNFISRSFSSKTGVSFPAKAIANLLFMTKIILSENLQLESTPPSTARFNHRFLPQCNILPQADLPKSYK